ncbi:MAG TPA: nuclear transport factor 2 family protein [Steroidobacteraceae bacterium]|nr:nuclear transport factor 2 family protein [Steroidobacteraceae bacterium]
MLTEADFRSYIAAFNRNDAPGYSHFYADDVHFVGRAAELHGRDAIVEFYRGVKRRLRETLTVHGVIATKHALVADVETELHALEDWPDFPTGAFKRGDTRRSQNVIWYDVAGDQFTRIRAARYRILEPGEIAPDTVAKPDAGMTSERFAAYIDAFNRDDYAGFGDFYHDDVTLVIAGKRELRGRQAICDFYRGVKATTRRTIQINNVATVGNQLAAELQSEFEALEDLPDFTAGPMKKGGRLFINTVVLYELRDGKFVRIRSGELRKISRP